MLTEQEARDAKEHVERLSSSLKEMQTEVIARVMEIERSPTPRSVGSLHGFIGGKNNLLADCIHNQFPNPTTFIAHWFRGLRQSAITDIAEDRPYRSTYRLARIMQDYVVRDYTIAFLERNFYRQYLERTRTKPDESLWSLWFGNNSMSWGFFITPVFRHGIWTNDVSEIRRAKFHYWTIGHVLSTGFVDPDAGENGGVFKFDDIDQFLGFYESVLRRVSNSQYEKAIFASYVKYIKQSKDPDQEPFLIPELRFAGKDTDHKHRLDFAVLNAHTMKFVGFELSPHSTHGAIKKAKEKTQKAINAEGAETWKNEMIKRNRYFAKYGITTVTFTDTDLEDMEACFECMLGTIESRGEPEPQLEDEVTAICQLSLDRPRE